MRLFVGSTRSRSFCTMLEQKNIGRVSSPESVCPPYHGEKWIADNGAFSAYLKGKQLDEDRYMSFIEKVSEFYPKPCFAVVPDIVADGDRSLEYSLEWITSGRLPKDFRWYLAVQDGMSFEQVKESKQYFDGIFIGGTLRFKAHASSWKGIGLPVHFGRAGVHDRIHFAYRSGCDSCDSSFPLWTEERFRAFLDLADDNGHYRPGKYKQIDIED